MSDLKKGTAPKKPQRGAKHNDAATPQLGAKHNDAATPQRGVTSQNDNAASQRGGASSHGGVKALTGKKRALKGSVQLSPVPAVLVTCADGDVIDVVTVAWTGIVCTHPPMTYISLRPERYSYGIIEKTGEFVINLPPASLVRELDLCGMKSGRNLDKIDACGLTLDPAVEVLSPLLREAPLSLECKVKQKLSLGSHDMFLAEIVSVDADEALFNTEGRLCMEKAGLIAYAHGAYYTLGKKLGLFGFSTKKKKKRTVAKKR
ncbi:MAG: flavin reductase family protein [Clostridia bacterium]|nr:flavin reductase family protein [Clostridia bacterium]